MASLPWPFHIALDWLFSGPALPEPVLKMRDFFAKAASELGLNHISGGDAHCDAIEGNLDGYQILIIICPDFEVQRPVIAIAVCTKEVTSQLPILEPELILQAYDQNAGSHGPLIAEERAWLLGHRLGNGVRGNANQLLYRQYWEMESSDLSFVCRAMVKIIPYLDADRTRIQGGSKCL